MHDSLSKDTHFVVKDPPKLNNAIHTCLISWNIILYYSQSSDLSIALKQTAKPIYFSFKYFFL